MSSDPQQPAQSDQTRDLDHDASDVNDTVSDDTVSDDTVDGLTSPVSVADPADGPEGDVETQVVDLAAANWVVEMWVDADWYALQNSSDPMPPPGPPVIFALDADEALIGRASRSRGVAPDIDCAADTGISREQARLSRHDGGWSIEDLQSANGTYLAQTLDAPSAKPIPTGQPVALALGSRIYLGAWTCLVVRPG